MSRRSRDYLPASGCKAHGGDERGGVGGISDRDGAQIGFLDGFAHDPLTCQGLGGRLGRTYCRINAQVKERMLGFVRDITLIVRRAAVGICGLDASAVSCLGCLNLRGWGKQQRSWRTWLDLEDKAAPFVMKCEVKLH
jgi:hypothetical protein